TLGASWRRYLSPRSTTRCSPTTDISRNSKPRFLTWLVSILISCVISTASRSSYCFTIRVVAVDDQPKQFISSLQFNRQVRIRKRTRCVEVRLLQLGDFIG